VTRRNFLQVVAAALFAPVPKLRPPAPSVDQWRLWVSDQPTFSFGFSGYAPCIDELNAVTLQNFRGWEREFTRTNPLFDQLRARRPLTFHGCPIEPAFHYVPAQGGAPAPR
jgi:hypothetical protein